MKPISALLAAISLLAVIATTQADAATVAKSSATPDRRLDHCSWERPGVDPFMGDVVAAVDHYRDMAPETRQKLKARMVKRDYDEIVSIDRDGIRGKSTYGTTIRDMHFGTNQVCGNVTRASWKPEMKERGLVYCEGRECILVPTVCRNVSRITRAEVMGGTATDDDAGPDTALAAAPVLAPPADVESGGGEPVSGGRAAGLGEPGSFAALSGGGAGDSTGGSPDGGGFGPGGPTYGPGSAPEGRPSQAPDNIGPGPGPSPVTPRLPGGSSPITGPITPVPEPQSWLLMAAGLVELALFARRRVSRRA